METIKENKKFIPHKRTSIRAKLQLVIVVLVCISTLLIALAAIKSILKSYETVNKDLVIALVTRYQHSTQHQTETMQSILEPFVANYQNKKIPAATLEQIKSIVRSAKYNDGDGYFFLYDSVGTVMAHGDDPMLEGKNLLNVRDPHGLPVIELLRNAAQQGGGFVTYYWNKPSDLIGRYKKISYATMLKNTTWWVGTGIYLDHVDQVVGDIRDQQEVILKHLLIQFLVLTVTLIIFSLIMSLYFAARISKPIIALSRIAKKISGGNYEVRAKIERDDELGDMAGSFNNMADSINEKIKDLVHKERYTAHLLESIADGVMVTNAENKIVQVNRAAEIIFNYARNELINKNVCSLIPEDLREDYKVNVLDQVFLGKTITNYNVMRFNKDGAELALAVTVAPIVEDDGSIYLRVHSIKDMTEQYDLKNQIRHMENLKKYFPNQIIEKLIEGDGKVSLGYDRRKLTIFFSDLVGFTELSDALEAEEIISILSEYLTSMSNIVYKYSGTLDKFIGDAIMVFFGAPTTAGLQLDAINCINMALDMQEKLTELNQSWNLAAPLNVRIGINTGFVTVGNFGSDIRLEYTIIGTPVNIASRLEHDCKPGYILISYETAQLVKDKFILHEVEAIKLKGIYRLVKAFEVVRRV
ncbi:MAG: cache domain-containing protein [Gammaproteobacteria bacterium]